MSSINTVKGLLDNRFSDGRYKLRATVQTGSENYPKKGILLFYDNGLDNNIIALGRHTAIGLYDQPVQIAILHDNYDKSRTIAYQVIEYLNTQRPTGIVNTAVTAPIYAGINDVSGTHIFTINIRMKGDK